MTKKVLTPKGEYVSLEESGLQFFGIKTDEQIKFHNQMQARFNDEIAQNEERCKCVEKIEKTIKEIVEKNNLQSEYKEIKSHGFSLLEEILTLMQVIMKKDDYGRLNDCLHQLQSKI